MRTHRLRLSALTLVIALAGCAPSTPSGSETTASVEPSVEPVRSGSPSAAAEGFPIETFAGLGDEPVSDALAAELQEVLDRSGGRRSAARSSRLSSPASTKSITWAATRVLVMLAMLI